MNNKKVVAIAVIAVIAVGAGSFYGGTIYEKSRLEKQGLIRSSNISDRMQKGGQRATPGGFNRGGENGEFVAGEIISKDEKSITVKTKDGGSKIVFFSDSTQIGKTTQGSSVDLNNKQEVVINGQSNSDGSIVAQNIQIRPARQN